MIAYTQRATTVKVREGRACHELTEEDWPAVDHIRYGLSLVVYRCGFTM
jgi:hypothetical protein